MVDGLSSGPKRFTMPPPPRSLAQASSTAGDLGFQENIDQADGANFTPPEIVIEQVQPPRRRRSDAVLVIGILTGLAVIAGVLAAAVLLRN